MKIDYNKININGMCYVREVKNINSDRAGYLLINNENKPIKDVYYYLKERVRKHGDEINSIKRKAHDLCYLYDFMNITNSTPELLTNKLIMEFLNGYLRVINPHFRVHDCIERSMLTKLPILEEYKTDKTIFLNISNTRGLDNKSIARILNNIKMYLIFLAYFRNKDVDLDKLFLLKSIKVHKENTMLGHLGKNTREVYSINGILKASKIPYRNRKKVGAIDKSKIFEENERKLLFIGVQKYSPSIKLLFNLLDLTGLRISEALALNISDYNISSGDAFLFDTNSDIRLQDKDNNVWQVDVVYRHDNPSDLKIKFNKSRTIQFIDSEKHFYNLYKQAILHRAILMKSKRKKHKYLFINTYGDRMRYPRINQIFNNIMEEEGLSYRLRELTIHSIRHTYSSRWIKCMRNNHSDIELEELSRILGHESSETTRQTYIHLFKEDRLKLLKKMNECTYQKGDEQNEHISE